MANSAMPSSRRTFLFRSNDHSRLPYEDMDQAMKDVDKCFKSKKIHFDMSMLYPAIKKQKHKTGRMGWASVSGSREKLVKNRPHWSEALVYQATPESCQLIKTRQYRLLKEKVWKLAGPTRSELFHCRTTFKKVVAPYSFAEESYLKRLDEKMVPGVRDRYRWFQRKKRRREEDAYRKWLDYQKKQEDRNEKAKYICIKITPIDCAGEETPEDSLDALIKLGNEQINAKSKSQITKSVTEERSSTEVSKQAAELLGSQIDIVDNEKKSSEAREEIHSELGDMIVEQSDKKVKAELIEQVSLVFSNQPELLVTEQLNSLVSAQTNTQIINQPSPQASEQVNILTHKARPHGSDQNTKESYQASPHASVLVKIPVDRNNPHAIEQITTDSAIYIKALDLSVQTTTEPIVEIKEPVGGQIYRMSSGPMTIHGYPKEYMDDFVQINTSLEVDKIMVSPKCINVGDSVDLPPGMKVIVFDPKCSCDGLPVRITDDGDRVGQNDLFVREKILQTSDSNTQGLGRGTLLICPDPEEAARLSASVGKKLICPDPSKPTYYKINRETGSTENLSQKKVTKPESTAVIKIKGLPCPVEARIPLDGGSSEDSIQGYNKIQILTDRRKPDGTRDIAIKISKHELPLHLKRALRSTLVEEESDEILRRINQLKNTLCSNALSGDQTNSFESSNSIENERRRFVYITSIPSNQDNYTSDRTIVEHCQYDTIRSENSTDTRGTQVGGLISVFSREKQRGHVLDETDSSTHLKLGDGQDNSYAIIRMNSFLRQIASELNKMEGSENDSRDRSTYWDSEGSDESIEGLQLKDKPAQCRFCVSSDIE